MDDKHRIKDVYINVDMENIHEFYARRAIEKTKVNIDAPVILSTDRDPSHAEYWTKYELEKRIPFFELDEESKVLELGFGTGRIAKYITKTAKLYVGIDYVQEFVDLAKKRDDIYRDEQTFFVRASFSEAMNGQVPLPVGSGFNRFMVAAGVFMYINDTDLERAIAGLIPRLEQKCILYFSEPVATKYRLTLKDFHSKEMNADYSAIYRTLAEYDRLFEPFYQAGFRKVKSEEFFETDIKGWEETKQWFFLLKRD